MLTPNTKQVTLHSIVRSNVCSGPTIYTDDNLSYTKAYRQHKVINHFVKEYVNEVARTSGLYHNWNMKYCLQYVNEFVFCLNNGNCNIDVQDHMDRLFTRMRSKHITYKELM